MQEPWTDRIVRFYDWIALIELEGEQKADVAKRIIDDMNIKGDYRIQMVLAAIIAALWLLINSTPVVIGAMLIAPILRPIQAASFWIATGNRKLILRSIWILLLTIALGVFSSLIVTLIIPLTQLTQEILIRTEPTLIDLAIALASWVVGFLAFGYEKITDSIAWVAVAASLVPPLSVVWVGLALWNGLVAQGSFLLFLTNLIAIIFVGIILFYMFGFYPNQKKELRRSVINIIWVVWVMAALSVPLASTLVGLVRDARIQTLSEQRITQFLAEQTPESVVQQIDVSPGAEEIIIDLVVQTPESQQLNQLQKEELTRLLAEEFSSDVRLAIRSLPYTNVRTEELIQVDPYQSLQQTIDEFLRSVYPEATLLTYRLIQRDSTTLLADIITNAPININRFERSLNEYLLDQWAPVDTILASVTVLDPTEGSTDDRQNRLDAIRNSIERSIIDTYIQDVRISELPSGQQALSVVGVTTLTQPVFQTAFSQRQEQNSALIPEWADVRGLIQYVSSTRQIIDLEESVETPLNLEE